MSRKCNSYQMTTTTIFFALSFYISSIRNNDYLYLYCRLILKSHPLWYISEVKLYHNIYNVFVECLYKFVCVWFIKLFDSQPQAIYVFLFHRCFDDPKYGCSMVINNLSIYWTFMLWLLRDGWADQHYISSISIAINILTGHFDDWIRV